MSVNVPKKTHLVLYYKPPEGFWRAVLYRPTPHTLQEAATRKEIKISNGSKEIVWRRLPSDVNFQILGRVFMPTNWVPCFYFWPSPTHFPHRGQEGLLKCDWVLLFTCLKPAEELPLYFKVNPNLWPHPSKHSLAFLCSPFQTHFRSPNLISALQTEIFLS